MDEVTQLQKAFITFDRSVNWQYASSHPTKVYKYLIYDPIGWELTTQRPAHDNGSTTEMMGGGRGSDDTSSLILALSPPGSSPSGETFWLIHTKPLEFKKRGGYVSLRCEVEDLFSCWSETRLVQGRMGNNFL